MMDGGRKVVGGGEVEIHSTVWFGWSDDGCMHMHVWVRWALWRDRHIPRYVCRWAARRDSYSDYLRSSHGFFKKQLLSYREILPSFHLTQTKKYPYSVPENEKYIRAADSATLYPLPRSGNCSSTELGPIGFRAYARRLAKRRIFREGLWMFRRFGNVSWFRDSCLGRNGFRIAGRRVVWGDGEVGAAYSEAGSLRVEIVD